MRLLVGLIAAATSLRAQSPEEVKAAVSRALVPLQSSTANFVAKRACVSCHHNILSILAFHMAGDRGFKVDPAVLSAAEEKTFRGLRKPEALDEAIQATTLNDPTPDDSYLLMAAKAAGIEPGLVTAVYAQRLANWQRDGHWVTSDFRPPHSSSNFTATATAIAAIRAYMPYELRAGVDACILRAREWLTATRPVSTEDASFRLLGLVWADASAVQVAAARRDLLAMRKPAGAWPQLPGYDADAYSTGEALYALHESGVLETDAAWHAGLKFLLRTQAPNGTWHVRTRMLSPADVSPKYFTTGFPYDKDEYISYAASCWAVMALLTTLPATAASPSQRSQQPSPGQWRDVDPLMHLARGVKADANAVRIAAAYRGSAASIEALLDAGAEIPPKALVFASMSGDIGNVKLLLARGAEPSAAALSQAVTFGYADIVRTLIAAGAPAKITEKSGINLLHWAAIANRAAVIPELVKAGVPVNATDENGFTPLMYAATIDFGDTETLKALLQAGADPNIRNNGRRTAREQAHYFGHAALEAALRPAR